MDKFGKGIFLLVVVKVLFFGIVLLFNKILWVELLGLMVNSLDFVSVWSVWRLMFMLFLIFNIDLGLSFWLVNVWIIGVKNNVDLCICLELVVFFFLYLLLNLFC